MALSSKNPVVGFVPCQYCGKPSPTHYPKGGNRKNTLYYNCLEHKSQSGTGVGEYCQTHQVNTLLEYVQKYGQVEECAELQVELENAGLMATPLPAEELETVDELDEVPDDAGLPEEPPAPHETSDTADDEPEQLGAGLIWLVVFVLVLGGLAYLTLKSLKPETESESEAQAEAPPEPQVPPQKGVLM